MKLVIEKVKHQVDTSFAVEHNYISHFVSPWHFHPETEIILIVQGSGTLFAGDYMKPFAPGAIALIGPNLPHVWMNDKEYFKPKSKLIAESIVIKFSDIFPGKEFISLPESIRIKKLLEQSSRGIIFLNKTRKILEEKILDLSNQKDFDRIILVMSILNLMSKSNEFIFLSSKGYNNVFNDSDCERIDKVYKFVMDNYTRDISLDEISSIANMSPTAFCRYFKARTLKTFSEFVNEVRIGYACKLLIEKKYSISEVSYRCGYNYLSNFFKQFRVIMKMTPLEYQNKYWN